MNQYFRQLILAILVSFLLSERSAAHGNDNPSGVAGEWNGSITTGGSYDPYTGNAHRVVQDIAVAASVGAYPLNWTRTLNTRGTVLINQFGQGGIWTHSYDWHLSIHPAPTPGPTGTPIPDYEGSDGTLIYPDGRTADLYEPWIPGGCEASGAGPFGVSDLIVKHSGEIGNGEYDLLLGDGGKVKFRHLTGSNYLVATEIVDPYGQTTLLARDAAGRLDTITEQLGGRYLKINYQPYPGTLIDNVQAFDGLGRVTQTVRYQYTEMVNRYYLTRVDYDDDTFATYAYYGPGNPGAVPVGLINTCNDVRYAGPMKTITYEYLTIAEHGDNVPYGQIKREKNVNGGMVSEISYPHYNDADQYWRMETRPGNVTRSFHYGNGFLAEFSDFSNPPNWSRNEILYPGPGESISRWEFTDARGHITHWEAEGVINAPILLRHPSPGESTVETEYSDPNHPYYVSSRKNENGKTTLYTRDGRNRVQRIEYPDYPDNGFEEFTYNEFDQIKTHRMTSGGVENFTYDGRGLKTESWPPATLSDPNPESHKTLYFYYGGPSGPGSAPTVAQPDLIDRLQRVIDPRGNSTWYEYNERGQTTRVTHQDGSYTESDYNDDGTLAWTTDELGNITTYRYDEYKRVTAVTNHLGEYTTNSYDPLNGQGPLSHTTSSVYRVTTHMGKQTEYDFDNNFRRIRMTQAPGVQGETATTLFIPDEVGNLISVEDPRHKFSTYVYDERNRQTAIRNAEDETTTMLYDFVGNKTNETRHDGTFRSWDYDAMNRLRHAYDWRLNPVPEPHQTTTYVRDHAGNALSITDTKGAEYEFEYDALNRKESASYPHDPALPAPTETWQYDVAGNLTIYKNPAGQHKHIEYDSRNRPWHSSWQGVAGAGQQIVTEYDAANRITSIVTNNGETTVAFGYDEANRKLWEDQTLAGQPTRRVKTDLDSDGRRETLEIVDPPQEGGGVIFSPEMSGSGSYSITYEYTERNQVKTIQGAAEENWAVNYIYNLSGSMTERKIVSNGISSSTNCPNLSYDALNRPTKWEQTGPNGFYASSHYQYDEVNREIATWREEEDNLGERFTYEPTNQLKTAAYNGHVADGPPPDAERTVTYEYTPDKLNRASMNDNGAVINYSFNALNQYTGVAGSSYSYDDNFNLTHAVGFNGVYDAANRLVSASNGGGGQAPQTIAGFVYDGLGRCVKRTLNGVATVFVYDGWKPIGEFDEWGSFQAWNVYGPGADEILLRQSGKYGYVRFHSDRHGNVAFLLDNDGAVVEKCTYDAFGRPKVTDADGENPRSWSYYGHQFLFQGREYIHQLEIYDYRNRFYLPALGRFLQTDPTGFGAGDMNLFRYCGDDPVDLSDPLGLEGELFGPGQLESAVEVARRQVEAANSAPDRKSAIAKFRDMSRISRIRPEVYYPSKMVPVLRHGKGYEVGKTYDGRLVYIKGVPIEVEAPPLEVQRRTALPVHGHNDKKSNTTTPGLAVPRWSDLDLSLRDVDRQDESTGTWYSRRNGKDVPSDFDSRQKASRTSDAGNGNSSNGITGSDVSSAPSAAEVDAAHQGTGVPSLAAEAVNFAPGRP